MTTCPYCRTPARFPHVLLSATYICQHCRRPSVFRWGSSALLGVFAGLTTWVALVLTHRSLGTAWSFVVGAAVGCAAGLLGSYLCGRLLPVPNDHDKPRHDPCTAAHAGFALCSHAVASARPGHMHHEPPARPGWLVGREAPSDEMHAPPDMQAGPASAVGSRSAAFSGGTFPSLRQGIGPGP